MNDGVGVRGGGVAEPASKPAQCEEHKRLLCVSYRRVARGEGGGKGVCTGTEHEGAGRRGGGGHCDRDV